MESLDTTHGGVIGVVQVPQDRDAVLFEELRVQKTGKTGAILKQNKGEKRVKFALLERKKHPYLSVFRFILDVFL